MATHYEYHGAWYIQWTQAGKRQKEWVGRTEVVSEREAKLRAKALEKISKVLDRIATALEKR